MNLTREPIVGEAPPEAEGGPHVVTWPELLTKDYPPPVLLLAPWLETRTVNMIHGWRGCGKTRMAHGIAVSVAAGIEIIPGWQPRQTGRALIVDGELSGHELQKRISTLLLSYGIDTGERLGFLIGRDYPRGLPSLDGPEGRGMLERAIEKHKPDLLILDSASTLLRTADENSSADWQAHQDYLLGLTFHGVSPLIVHHDGKGGTQRGASKREDILAESIGLKSPEDADETDGTRVLVTYGKHRNFYGREAIPFITELIDGRWRSDEPQENRLAIAARLSAEGKSVRAIAEEMSLSKSAAGRLLARSKRDR